MYSAAAWGGEIGHVGDPQAQPVGRGQVHVAVAGGPHQQVADPVRPQLLQHRARNLIGGEHADGQRALGQRYGVFAQPYFQQLQVVAVRIGLF